MLFSLEWLLELCPVRAEPGAVADALTSRGLTVDSVESSPGGTVLDVDVPANRPDCLGHAGLARELSAAFGVPLAPPAPAPQAAGPPTDKTVAVDIEDPTDCPRYTAGLVRGVRIGPSPDWVVRRLECCGLRAVSNAVDASNLVLLQLGHPIHFFDLDRLRGNGQPARIGVRRAGEGERLKTLDDVDRPLDPGTLLITDEAGPIALAGVIGGASSEISDVTRDVLIEAARFRPQSVRRAAKRLGIATDASYRFERGVDAESAIEAQRLAVSLLTELAGGTPAPGFVDAYPAPAPRRELSLRRAQLDRLLGYAPDPLATRDALGALGIETIDDDGQRLRVRIPSWRDDLQREADLVEEVARHLGYDQIPVADAGAKAAEHHSPSLGEAARDLMAHQGFQEAVGYAMIAEGEDARFVDGSAAAPVQLDNPIAETMSRLRRSMLPGLLRFTALNLRRGAREVRLFEVGKVFLREADGAFPREPSRLGLVWSGPAQPPHWNADNRAVDLFDLMGVVEHVLRTLRPGVSLGRSPLTLAGLHPGHSVRWILPDGTDVAWGGALHPELEHELDAAMFVAELDLDRLGAAPAAPPRHVPLPRYPAVNRDLAVVLTAGSSYARVLEVLEAVEAPAPVLFSAVDHYEGPPLAPGEMALTIRVRLQPADRTLTDPETEAYRQALVQKLEQDLGLRIRG